MSLPRVKTGAAVLQGSTDEYYAIIDSSGTQLASAHLGHALSLVPGAYSARLNNITMTVQVDAGHTGEYQSGSLTVKMASSAYYAVLDASGTQLASKPVNQPVSLPAGKYSVRLGNNIRPATVTAGQSVVLNWWIPSRACNRAPPPSLPWQGGIPQTLTPSSLPSSSRPRARRETW